MPRVARFVIPDIPHHITQRGNYRQQVFFNDDDYRLYLDLLAEFAPKYRLSIQAFCLMPNHIHLVATPENKQSLSRTLQRVHCDYARATNLRHRRTGHLWQARYHSVPLDEEHFWAAMVYIEQNPTRAALIDNPTDYPWSSAPLRLTNRSTFLSQDKWRQTHNAQSWQSCLHYGLHQGNLFENIRAATRNGWPLGNENFQTILEQHLGFRPLKRHRGRPRATQALS